MSIHSRGNTSTREEQLDGGEESNPAAGTALEDSADRRRERARYPGHESTAQERQGEWKQRFPESTER